MPFAYANDIWKHDPFDVESIHRNAREKFQRIVGRVLEPSGLASGRILLLLGESGCGKTHLMRAFRNQVHSRSSGYCGYLQMTAFTGQYGRYVLNNLIDSLDKPYDESRSETTGLMRLSNALAESCRDVPRDRTRPTPRAGTRPGGIDQLVGELADSIILDDRFSTIDVYLVQALLYLQRNDPPIKARVLKYLRCEDLTEARPAVTGRNRSLHLSRRTPPDHRAAGAVDLGRRAGSAGHLRRSARGRLRSRRGRDQISPRHGNALRHRQPAPVGHRGHRVPRQLL